MAAQKAPRRRFTAFPLAASCANIRTCLSFGRVCVPVVSFQDSHCWGGDSTHQKWTCLISKHALTAIDGEVGAGRNDYFSVSTRMLRLPLGCWSLRRADWNVARCAYRAGPQSKPGGMCGTSSLDYWQGYGSTPLTPVAEFDSARWLALASLQ